MARVRVLPFADLKGGLNLRDGAAQLGRNETDDLLNVDLLPSGGVERRGTVLTWSSGLTETPEAIFHYTSSLVAHVVTQCGNDICWASDDGAFTKIILSGTAGRMRSAVASSVALSASGPDPNAPCMYLTRGTGLDAVRYEAHVSTSPTVTVLSDAAAAWNDDVAVPVGGRFPRAGIVIEHNGFVWAANTVEDGVGYGSRLRWSHPGQPEDWRSFDYWDVAPGRDGDEITGLASLGQRLLIFKRSAIYELAGPSPELFRLVPVTTDVGACSHEAIAESDQGLAFFDDERGMFLLSQDGLSWLWERLHEPILFDGTIPVGVHDQIRVAWLNHKLFVSVPWQTTVNARTFVLDPLVGGWTVYGLGFSGLLDWHPPNFQRTLLGLSPSSAFVWEIDGGSGAGDILDGTETAVGFESYFKTPWFDARLPAAQKRWRRVHLVADADYDTVYRLSSWKDYNPLGTARSWNVSIRGRFGGPETTTSSTVLYDSALAYDSATAYEGGTVSSGSSGQSLVWGEGVWGQYLWGSATDGAGVIRRSWRGPGVAEAVQLKVQGPSDRPWNIDRIDLKYIPMKVLG
jgi:hypothetical protein